MASIKLPEQTLTLPMAGGPIKAMDSASIGTGMAFLNAELEKRDPAVLEPLQSVTWPRDITPRYGGGWVEFSSQYGSDYQSTGGNEYGVVGGQTNDIPIIQANVAKQIWKVFTFANILKVSFVDQQKMQGIGRSLDDLLTNGLKLNYNKSLDYNTYLGFGTFGSYGLLNNPDVTATTAAATGTGSSTKWKDKTPQQILDDVNTAIESTWANSQYDLTGMANHVLLPPEDFTYINNQPVTSAGTQSILNFLLENNIAVNQGRDLVIVPCRWCIGQGAGGTDRMMVYVNEENRVNMDITVPLSRLFTQPDVRESAYLTNYSSQFSEVKVLFVEPMLYVDGI